MAYDTDGDGDFDVEDAKVLLGKFDSSRKFLLLRLSVPQKSDISRKNHGFF